MSNEKQFHVDRIIFARLQRTATKTVSKYIFGVVLSSVVQKDFFSLLDCKFGKSFDSSECAICMVSFIVQMILGGAVFLPSSVFFSCCYRVSHLILTYKYFTICTLCIYTLIELSIVPFRLQFL